MPKSEVTRVVFSTSVSQASDGPKTTFVTVPAGYRIISASMYGFEDGGWDQLTLNGSYPMRDPDTGITNKWAFKYTIDTGGTISGADIYFLLIAERSEEPDVILPL